MKKICLLLLAVITGCVTIPKGLAPVDAFDLPRYLGTWYEIARLDHSFERGLTRVTAEYSLSKDGSVRVINRGYLAKEKKWKEARGRAHFVHRPDQGFLKVSFFGPFYGSYIILELDAEKYSWALVCGPDRSYLWILSRTPRMDPVILDRLIARAAADGFDTRALIVVDHLPAEE